LYANWHNFRCTFAQSDYLSVVKEMAFEVRTASSRA
jgi:hypothetical protein